MKKSSENKPIPCIANNADPNCSPIGIRGAHQMHPKNICYCPVCVSKRSKEPILRWRN